jgi:serine/threonine protein kinase
MMTVYPECTKKLVELVLEDLYMINNRVKIVSGRILHEKKEWKDVIAKVVLEGTHTKEIDVWKQLSHTNIAPLLCTCECNGYLFMFTDRGAPIYGSNSKSEVETFSILKHIATGLSYLHRLGFVHLDLKVENTIVVDGVVKIIDFEGVYHERYKDNLTNTSRFSPPGLSYAFLLTN